MLEKLRMLRNFVACLSEEAANGLQPSRELSLFYIRNALTEIKYLREMIISVRSR